MKKFIKYPMLVAASVAVMSLHAQNIKPNDWINQNVENGVFGLGINSTYDYITKNKLKVKSKPIVAILCGGIDYEHEALKDNMWVNAKEKVDGKDNDGNLLTDDINGWNFIGGKDGVSMDILLQEGDREYLRLRSKYDGLSKDENGFFRYEDKQTKRIYVQENVDTAEWSYFINKIRPESMLARSYGGYTFAYTLREYANIFNDQLKAKFPNQDDFDMKDFPTTCWDKNGPQNEMQNTCMTVIGMYAGLLKTQSWNRVFDQYKGEKQITLAKNSFDEVFQNYGSDSRKEIVGDDFMDINDKTYGNNTLLTGNSITGTMAAGIIAGKRGVEGRNNPIAEHAKIMPLVVVGKAGEPYLKDLALAIRYAVDNGASVITLPQQNTLFPTEGRKWVADAILYAESKNVMIIVPSWELSCNMDEIEFFPNRNMIQGKVLSNLLVVSPSKKDGSPFLASNYGVKSVDLYTPAEGILSTYMGDTYQAGSGTVIGCATTAGVVALIKTYYPELTNAQIRDIIISSCTSRKGIEVEKGIIINNNNTQDLYLFDELCVSGGILNAYNAFIEAGKFASGK